MDFALSDILHAVGQALFIPCTIVLLTLMVVAVWQVGDLIIEVFTERRKNKVDVPGLLRRIQAQGPAQISLIIEESLLPRRQREALQTLIQAEDMSPISRAALAQRLLANEEEHYERGTAVTDIVAKLGPMFGLLGTLIPLGPGIVALGMGDTATLSKSLAVAFDSTIAGLISAAVCYVISNIRKRWYNSYIASLEAIMECILEEVEADAQKRQAGPKAQVRIAQ